MTGLLLTQAFLDEFGGDLDRAASQAGVRFEHILLPADPEDRVTDEDAARAEIAIYSGDVIRSLSRSFFSTCYRAPQLGWVHLRNAGVDHPAFARLLERGVRVTNSAGASAEPIAQSAIAGMLMLSRSFPHYLEAQRRGRWEQLEDHESLPDLSTQTLVVFGVGAIGGAIARMARAIGLTVVGVRRSPLRAGDPVDELHHPDRLRELLPRADWLAIASPLSPETRGLFDAETLALLPRGAHVINVGRGPIVDERALIEALRSGHLGGAYLDVFEEEPLPSESPLWGLPRVVVTPHNCGTSSGNDRRSAEIFFTNVGRWSRGEPLANEVREAGS